MRSIKDLSHISKRTLYPFLDSSLETLKISLNSYLFISLKSSKKSCCRLCSENLPSLSPSGSESKAFVEYSIVSPTFPDFWHREHKRKIYAPPLHCSPWALSLNEQHTDAVSQLQETICSVSCGCVVLVLGVVAVSGGGGDRGSDGVSHWCQW